MHTTLVIECNEPLLTCCTRQARSTCPPSNTLHMRDTFFLGVKIPFSLVAPGRKVASFFLLKPCLRPVIGRQEEPPVSVAPSGLAALVFILKPCIKYTIYWMPGSPCSPIAPDRLAASVFLSNPAHDTSYWMLAGSPCLRSTWQIGSTCLPSQTLHTTYWMPGGSPC
jgi:hypothetical protein